MWCILVKVGREWVKAAVVANAIEARVLAARIEALGKRVRVLPW